MTEEFADPRSVDDVLNDTVDRSPGFTDLVHRYNLIGNYKDRTLTAEEALILAREAYEVGILEQRKHPEEIDKIEQEFNRELAGLRH